MGIAGTSIGGTTGSGGVLSTGGSATGGTATGGTATGGTATGGTATGGTATGGTATGGTATGGTATGGTATGGTATGGTATGGTATGGTATGGTATGGTATGGTSCVGGSFQAPELITGLGLDSYDKWGPSLSTDGLTLYFSASLSGGTDDIYVATRADRGAAFSAAVALDAVNTTIAGEGSPCISSDGLSIYFYSTSNEAVSGSDIWRATRPHTLASFNNAGPLATVNSVADDHLQWLSPDQLTLMFSSARSGDGDIYIATRATKNGDFSSPVILGGVNSEVQEDRAAVTNDGLTIYFVSARETAGSVGEKDIWYATRANTQSTFSNVQNLTVVNGTARDTDVSLSADEQEMFFVSTRAVSGRAQIYRSVRSCQ